jgi:hypothetical protein
VVLLEADFVYVQVEVSDADDELCGTLDGCEVSSTNGLDRRMKASEGGSTSLIEAVGVVTELLCCNSAAGKVTCDVPTSEVVKFVTLSEAEAMLMSSSEISKGIEGEGVIARVSFKNLDESDGLFAFGRNVECMFSEVFMVV